MLVTKGMGNGQLMVTRGMSFHFTKKFREVINLSSKITLEFSKKSVISIRLSLDSKITTIRNLISMIFE